MKLKYYLRGLGIGIIITTIVLIVSFCGRDTTREMTDEEVMMRARELGMVMPEEDTEEQAPGSEEGEHTTSDAEEQAADDGSFAEEPQDGAVTDQADGGPVSDSQTDAGVTANPGEPYRLVIEPGDVCRVVCEKLAANGVIADAEALRTYLFEIGYASNMSIGEYDVPYGLTNEEIAQLLMQGPIEGTGE